MHNSRKARLLTGAAFAAAALAVVSVDAAWAAEGDATSVEEVIVTGTNIKRPNLVAASPLTRSSYHAGEDFAQMRVARQAQLNRAS